MKGVIGFLVFLIGLGIAIYVGLYILLFNGIIGLINGFNPLDATKIAINIMKILLASPVGYGIFILTTVIGGVIAGE